MQGLKEGQILRTISNMTYSDSHYTSDEEKLGEVSLCRPFPLLTLRPRPSLGSRNFSGASVAHPYLLYTRLTDPPRATRPCMLITFYPVVRGVILA